MSQWIRIQIGRSRPSPLAGVWAFVRGVMTLAVGLVVFVCLLPLIVILLVAGVIFGWHIRRNVRRMAQQVWHVHVGPRDAGARRPRKHVDSVSYPSDGDMNER
ncbi:MAG: hypothetical protein KGY99_11270 [Phycisphaerae bacterium]|nr:hypothetical protein [Phycisphaerae bacterium]